MKIKNIGIVFLIILLVIVGCQGKSRTQVPEEKNDKLENQEDRKNSEMPFNALMKDDIKEVEMSTSTEEIFFTEEEIAEFVDILKRIVIYEEIEPEPVSGGGEQFKITYSDGSLRKIDNNANIYIGIDGIWYEIEKEPIFKLSEFSDRILGITYP